MQMSTNFEIELLQVGDTFQKFDIWNTCSGLEFIPYSLIGREIKHKQPRDIFIRPRSFPFIDGNYELFAEWMRGKYN